MERNEGIQVTGGTFQAGAVAAGRNAQAIQNVAAAAEAVEDAGRDEIAQRLRELADAIAAHSERLDGIEELLQATETLAQEAAKPEPNRLTVRAVLNGLTEAAGSVSGVATAVTALRVALGALL
jgi:hypothetical protein